MSKKEKKVVTAVEPSDTTEEVNEETTNTPETVKLRAGTVLDGVFHPKGSVLEVDEKVKAQLKPFRYFG